MYESRQRAFDRIAKILGEIAPYKIRERKELEGWEFSGEPTANPPETGWEKVTTGYGWSDKLIPVWFRTSVVFPKPVKNENLVLEVWTGGESLVMIDGEPYGEINEFHRSLDITPLGDGREHSIHIQSVPKGLFGSHVSNPALESAWLLTIDREVERVLNDFYLADAVFFNTGDPALANRLLRLMDTILGKVRVPRDSDAYFGAVPDNNTLYDAGQYSSVNKIWKSEDFAKSGGNCLPEEYRGTVVMAGRELRDGLDLLKRDFPSSGGMTVAGHAHIDYAWLWPMTETKRKIRRTFTNAVRLAEKYPDFVYSQSSARMYEDIKESDPELFEKIRKLVKEGRWEPIGGMWVESDCNVTGAESLARQFLYGQRFFEKEFGLRSRTAWLPDVFGFPWSLPRILKESGIDFFCTTKLTWNEKNSLPNDFFIWRGIDGTEIPYHSFKNPLNGYNGNIHPKDILGVWNNYKNKAEYMKTMMSFGYGDGGGGPTDEMIDNYEGLKDYPGMPKLEMAPLQTFFESFEKEKVELPVWDDELYLELHRGTTSSQGRTKLLHKKAEDALYEAELLGAFAWKKEEYPKETLDRAWRIVLHNEFHDILPGSSIKEVYELAERELSEVIEEIKGVSERAASGLSDGDDDFISVMNTGSFPKRLVFVTGLTSGKKLLGEKGNIIEGQLTHDGRYVYVTDEIVKPFKACVFRLLDDPVEEPESDDDLTLENEYLKAAILSDGSIRVFDKTTGKELFKGSGNTLHIYKDIPSTWDAWDVDHNYRLSGEKITPASIRVIESGKIRKVIQVDYLLGKTSIVQKYILATGSNRIDIETKIDWHMRRTMLKALFPTDILARTANYDISAGYIGRSTTLNTDFEKARFEVPGHRWVDVSGYDFGVGILNNGKYGHNCLGSEISLTLLRSPVFPDFFADEGKQSFTYSITAHENPGLLKTVKEAEALNRQCLVTMGRLTLPAGLLEMDAPTVRAMAIKHGEERGWALRFNEVLGAAGTTVVRVALPITRAWKSNILEDRLEELEVKEGSFRLDYEPFGIYTVMVE